MVCPGLHSVYCALTVDLTDEIGMPEGIRFHTTGVNEMFRRVDLTVAGDGLLAHVSTSARHPPVESPTMGEIGRHVRDGEFNGATA